MLAWWVRFMLVFRMAKFPVCFLYCVCASASVVAVDCEYGVVCQKKCELCCALFPCLCASAYMFTSAFCVQARPGGMIMVPLPK